MENNFGRNFVKAGLRGLQVFLHDDQDPPDTHFYYSPTDVIWGTRYRKKIENPLIMTKDFVPVRTDLSFTAVSYTTSKSFDSLTRNQRGCVLDFELSLPLFERFSMTGCILQIVICKIFKFKRFPNSPLAMEEKCPPQQLS